MMAKLRDAVKAGVSKEWSKTTNQIQTSAKHRVGTLQSGSFDDAGLVSQNCWIGKEFSCREDEMLYCNMYRPGPKI